MSGISDEELTLFKSHIRFEEGMDETMLPFYLLQAKMYATNAGVSSMETILLVASIFFYNRVPEKEMKSAFDALTPLIIQELINGETDK